jgi:hypothetical protein
MKRRWNWHLWVGFALVVLGLFSYQLFVLFPLTRDFPWANLLLFAGGGLLLVSGLVRAFGRPAQYRGRIFGLIFAVVSVGIAALFSYGLFYVARQMPASAGAPPVGQRAPDFRVSDQTGKPFALGETLNSPETRAVLLIFYRGYW